MIAFLDKLYYSIPQANICWRCIKYLIRIITNIYVHYFVRVKKRKIEMCDDTIVVSLTSFPARIHNVWMTIKTLLNQDVENIRIILWLSNEQFESINALPKSLLKLQKEGLEIRLVNDDLRPHKKYFYAFKEFPKNIVITVDDDILYHPHLIGTLLENHKNHPNCVICNRGVKFEKSSYIEWKSNMSYDEERTDILPTGIGGVLYPPNSYDVCNIFNVSAIKRTCLHGDDLWLSFMTRKVGTKILHTGFKTGLITILSSQKTALCTTNVDENRNDKQIKALSAWAMENFKYDFYLEE